MNNSLPASYDTPDYDYNDIRISQVDPRPSGFDYYNCIVLLILLNSLTAHNHARCSESLPSESSFCSGYTHVSTHVSTGMPVRDTTLTVPSTATPSETA